MLCYCNKCGRVVQRTSKDLEKPCDYCNNVLQIVPKEFTADGLETCLEDDLKQQFIDQYIKSSPEFDQYLFDHRDEDLSKRKMENMAKLAHGRAILEGRDKGNKFGVECPYCHATNVKKISAVSKAGGVALFGIFGLGRAGKQWHCDRCGSDF